MAMPTITVEAALTTNPGATPTWTDLSSRFIRFSVNRGRLQERDTFQAGRATIVLDNTDRALDPTYAASPYMGNVLPMRRIRIRAVWAAVTYDVFNGYVDSWNQTYDPPAIATCTVQATDAFKVLAGIELTASVYEREVAADNPAFWWRLGEQSGSTNVLDRIQGRQLTRFGTGANLGAAGLANNDPDTAYSGSDAASGLADTGQFIAAGAADVTLEAIVKTTAAVDSSIVSVSETGAGQRFELFVTAAGKAAFKWGKTVGTNTQAATNSGTSTVNDGNPHHIVGVFNATAGSIALYVDGVLESGPGLVASILGGSTQELAIGNAAAGWVLPAAHSQGVVGTVDEVAIYAGQLSAARILAHATARATPWKDDLSGARIGRLLDAAGWPTADRNIDTGVAVLQSASLGGAVLTSLQQVEQTEQGALFVTAAGLVRFIARDSLLKAPYTTSQGTFGDSGAELEYGDLAYRYDDQTIINEARVSRVNGAVQVVADTTSQARYLRRTQVVDGLLHQADSTSLDLANWIIGHYKDPFMRVTNMRLEPSAGNDTTHFPHVLGRELMDRVTVLRRPQNLGAAISQDALIEGISHDVTAVEWKTTWNLSPAESQIYWILGTAGFSELDQTTRLGF